MVDHNEVGRMAFEHLRDRGLRQFGVIGHPTHLYSVEREAGFRKALGPTKWSCAAFHERASVSFRRRARLLALQPSLQRWLRTLPKPVGIFACHDVWGLQVVEACRLTGLRVPDDVAVIGVDNDDLLCELARPSLSSIVVPAEQIGFEAAALLDRLLRGGRPPKQTRLVPVPGLITRQSTDVVAGGDGELSAALQFIRGQSHRPLRVSDVLRELPISRRALEQRFQAVLHRGIAAEIRRVHLERARTLLATTTLSVSEVARQAGFSSVHYLSRQFHRETKETPTEFRRRIRGV
jgi:LacI family transcriptional regulator